MNQVNTAAHGIASGPGGGGSSPANARLFTSVVTYNEPGITEINPVAGEDAQIDLSAIGNAITINFPTPAAADEGKALGITLLSDLGSAGGGAGYNGPVDVLISSGVEQAGDCELFAWDQDTAAWKLVNGFRRSGMEYSIFSARAPTDATPIVVQPGEYTQISLSAATDNVPVSFVGGFAGQRAAIKCSAPVLPPASGIPFEFSIQPAGGTELKIRGDTGFFVCTSPGGWEQLAFLPGNPVMVYADGFVDADLSGGDLVISHRLNTLAPNVTIVNNAGALVPPGAGTWTMQVNNGVQCTITFDAGLLPLTDTWQYQVLGGPTPDLS